MSAKSNSTPDGVAALEARMVAFAAAANKKFAEVSERATLDRNAVKALQEQNAQLSKRVQRLAEQALRLQGEIYAASKEARAAAPKAETAFTLGRAWLMAQPGYTGNGWVDFSTAEEIGKPLLAAKLAAAGAPAAPAPGQPDAPAEEEITF